MIVYVPTANQSLACTINDLAQGQSAPENFVDGKKIITCLSRCPIDWDEGTIYRVPVLGGNIITEKE